MKIRGVCKDAINAWGDTGAAGDSVGGGAGVRRRARTREKSVVCGDGSVGTLVGLDGGDDLPAVGRLGFLVGTEVEGYSSNNIRSSSTMSWRVPTSPGFLSEYRREMSWTKGVGQELRNAKQPISDVERALKQRRSS